VKPRAKILGQLLLDAGAASEDALALALEEQRSTGERLGEALVRGGATTERAVAEALSVQLGLPCAPSPLEPEESALRLIRPELARARAVLPLRATAHALQVAMADPLDLSSVDDLAFHSGRRIEALVAEPSEIMEGLDRAYGGDLDKLVAELPAELRRTRAGGAGELERATRSAPVVRLVDRILHDAVEIGASDIHVEETGGDVHVRYRVDGILRRAMDLPAAARRAVLSRIKVMAGMDISVRRRAQDGRIALAHDERRLTLRTSTLPVNGGEKAVVRILDPDAAPRSLEALGMAPDDLERLRRLFRAGEGVLLAAGPTGSGKSTTLFAALSEMDRERQNVVTLEDPVEYRLPGANQVQVDRRAGLGFADALRSVLRQDPDVVMVGEIRDPETAEIAMAAAVTGHLVLSTIHTTDAPGALTRLSGRGRPRGRRGAAPRAPRVPRVQGAWVRPMRGRASGSDRRLPGPPRLGCDPGRSHARRVHRRPAPAGARRRDALSGRRCPSGGGGRPDVSPRDRPGAVCGAPRLVRMWDVRRGDPGRGARVPGLRPYPDEDLPVRPRLGAGMAFLSLVCAPHGLTRRGRSRRTRATSVLPSSGSFSSIGSPWRACTSAASRDASS